RWGEVDVTAGGAATLRTIRTDGVGYGGDIYVDAASITVNGPVQTGGTGDGGYIRFDATGDVTINASVTATATGSVIGDGGEIDFYVADLHVPTSGAVRANGVNGGSGGLLWLIIDNAAVIDGILAANG